MVGMVGDLPPPRRRSEAALRPQRHCLEIEQFAFGSPRANIGWVTNVLMDRRSRLTRRPFRTKRLVTHPQDHALIRFRRQPKMGPRRCILRRFFAGFSIAILSRYGLALPRGATTLNGCVKAICTPFCDIVLV
ncbi:unnamed protein product [Pelagomonas calceolata]|uniref:Uncharacterized protein n=1 Tax=Pelagomonas calceolata TaxID=35677 RepID=A0A8J2WMZ0_9STRA|nr:unnamed protein product [Pelagomonas calceolata]